VSVILVLALNPCVDAEWRVDGLRFHEKNLVVEQRRWAGGKGVNVARWLKLLGSPARLLLPLGGETGAELARGLRAFRLSVRSLPIREPTRINVVVTDPHGEQIRLNGAGPELSAAEWRRCEQAVRDELARASLLILSGSLPRGVPASTYARLIALARRAGVRTVLDCDGPALAAGVRARPFLVKPNEHELAQWAGRRLRSEQAVTAAAWRMSLAARGWVLVSRGAKDALLVNAPKKMAWRATPPRIRATNTVGAGDALLAAVVTALQAGVQPEDWLRLGLAAGTVAARHPAGMLPERIWVERNRRSVRVAVLEGKTKKA
jgi:1-phosphofructokinase family hexose kinase